MKVSINFNVSERIIILRFFDLLFIYLAFLFANYFFDFHYLNVQTLFSLHPIVFGVYYSIIAQVFEMYKLRDTASRFKTIRNLFVTTCVIVVLYLYTPLITPVLPNNRIEIAMFFTLIFLSVITWRMMYIATIATNKFYKRVLLICGDEHKLKDLVYYIDKFSRDNIVSGYVGNYPSKNIDFEYHPVGDAILENIIKERNINEVIVSLKGFSEDKLKVLNQQLITYFEHGINIIAAEDYIEKITFCVPKQNLNPHFYKYFNFSENHENKIYLMFLRILDICCSVLGLTFLFSILPFIWLINVFANRGPLFYSQERVGKNGKIFNILKLRSMVTDAEKQGAQWAVKNDTRITKFGKLLRKSRLDEIPQFWNVFKGEMCLIGPRPERPEFVAELEEKLPFYAIRHVVKPGLTGWAQVMFPYASTLVEQETKLRYDLYYIKKRGLFMDFKIVVKTINTVLYFKGN